MSSEQQAFSASLEKPSPPHSHFLLSSEQGYVHTVTAGETQPCEGSLHGAHLASKLTSAFGLNTNEFILHSLQIILCTAPKLKTLCTELYREHAFEISADMIGSVQYLRLNLD